MARPKKIETAQELDKHIDNFIDKCEKQGIIPSDWELMKFLDISVTTLETYEKEGHSEEDRERGTYKGYSQPLKKLIKYRESRLLKQLETTKGNNTAAIFQLKQAKNGGYIDVPTDTSNSNATLTLKIEGVGGIEAFR